MKNAAQLALKLQSLISKHRGVFTIQDLGNLFLSTDPVSRDRRLKSLLEAKLLYRFCRGIYVAEEFDLEWLSQKICPDSAISFGSVLAQEMLIGSIPQKTVYAVKFGKTRFYRSKLGQVVHLGFTSTKEARNLWFGYDVLKNGIRYANKEKAFLDVLYFYQLGQKFSFNIYSDIQFDKLNLKVLNQYLTHYKNPKFVQFVKGVLGGKHTIG